MRGKIEHVVVIASSPRSRCRCCSRTDFRSIFILWDDWGGFYDHAPGATPGPTPTIAAEVADPYVQRTMCPAGAPRASADMED